MDNDQIVPIADAAFCRSSCSKKGTLKDYRGYPHGMCAAGNAGVINALFKPARFFTS